LINSATTTASSTFATSGPITPNSASPGDNDNSVSGGGLKSAGGMSIPTVPPVLSPYSPNFHHNHHYYSHNRERDGFVSPQSPFPGSAGVTQHLVPSLSGGATISISRKLRGVGGGREILDSPVGPLVNVGNGNGGWRNIR